MPGSGDAWGRTSSGAEGLTPIQQAALGVGAVAALATGIFGAPLWGIILAAVGGAGATHVAINKASESSS